MLSSLACSGSSAAQGLAQPFAQFGFGRKGIGRVVAHHDRFHAALHIAQPQWVDLL